MVNIDRNDLMYGDQYNLSQAAVASISKYFQTEFAAAANATFNLTGNDYIAHQTEAVSPLKLNGWYVDRGHQPDIMQIVLQSANLTQTFQSVARSMTNAVRTGANNSTTSSGNTGSPTTLYSVRWPWIALHAVLFLAATAFLALSIYETVHRRVPVWKSSSLALLSLGDQVSNSMLGISTVSEMEEKAAQCYVRLFPPGEHEEAEELARLSLRGDAVDRCHPLFLHQSKQPFSDVVVREF